MAGVETHSAHERFASAEARRPALERAFGAREARCPSSGEVVLRVHARNGESPQWDAHRGCLYFVDMRAPALHCFWPGSGRHDWWNMPDWIGSFGIFEDGRLALALRTGLHLFDPAIGSMRWLAPAPYDPRAFCFNDGRTDPRGRLTVDPMYAPLGPERIDEDHSARAPLWRFNGRDGMDPLPIPKVRVSNGLAFSPNGRTLYHSDTPSKSIWACDYYPETGSVENQRLFARVEEGGDVGGPDGAAVDRDGFYICAVFGAGCLLRFDPAGRLERRIELPVRYPIMPAHGGENLDALYVTSAACPVKDLAGDPDAGDLLALAAPAPGLPTSYMPNLQEQGS